MQFPIFTITGRINTNPYAWGLDLELPMLTVVFEGGGEIPLRIPIFTAIIEGHVDPIAALSATLPRLTLDAVALTSGSGLLSKTLPALRIFSEASQDELSGLERALPMLLLSASATAGYVASLEKAYPGMTLSAQASWLAAATVSLELPPWKLTAFARGTSYGLSLNPRNMAFSSYTPYNYSSLAYFNGKVIGLSRTELVEMSGSSDGSTEIPWKIRTGKIDLAHNHLRQVWVTGKFGSRFTVTIEDIEGNRYEYEAVPWSDDPNEVRIKLGKGLRSRYVILELGGVAEAEIDQIKVFGVKGGMKR